MPATLRYPHYLLLLALALGICADSLFYQRWPGISIPLFVALCLAALGGISRLEDRPPTRANLWMGGAALGFAICLMLLALPVLTGFTLLLMAADSIFASYVNQIFSLRIPFDTEVFFSRLTLVLLVTWTCAGGMLVALHSTRKPTAPVIRGSLPAEGDTQPLTPPATSWRLLGWVEAVTVLVSVDLLFGGFMLIQTTYFFGGLDTLTRTGMTYAEYARRGFFELLAVACLALALLWLLALVTRREQPWQQLIFNATNALMILLVLGVLASAFQRMLLYEQAYGFTRLRIYTHSFMLWLALVLLLFLVALLRERPRLFTAGSFVSALIYLALLNLANPDALIVRENVARYQESGKLDAFYLTTLSNDAIPALVDALAVVEDPERKIILRELGWRHSHLSAVAAESGWPGWHLARARAVAATTPIAAAMNEEQME